MPILPTRPYLPFKGWCEAAEGSHCGASPAGVRGGETPLYPPLEGGLRLPFTIDAVTESVRIRSFESTS